MAELGIDGQTETRGRGRLRGCRINGGLAANRHCLARLTAALVCRPISRGAATAVSGSVTSSHVWFGGRRQTVVSAGSTPIGGSCPIATSSAFCRWGSNAGLAVRCITTAPRRGPSRAFSSAVTSSGGRG